MTASFRALAPPPLSVVGGTTFSPQTALRYSKTITASLAEYSRKSSRCSRAYSSIRSFQDGSTAIFGMPTFRPRMSKDFIPGAACPIVSLTMIEKGR